MTAYLTFASSMHFNPLAPRGARPGSGRYIWRWEPISIHSPRVGRDACGPFPCQPSSNFNPLAPRGARLPQRMHREVIVQISIHSPRVGRDSKSAQITRDRSVRFLHIAKGFCRNAGRRRCFSLPAPLFSGAKPSVFWRRFCFAPRLTPSEHPRRHSSALPRCAEFFRNSCFPGCRSAANPVRGRSAFPACA